jgi:hypothetical protein
MDIFVEYRKLIESDLFKEFISKSNGFYLVHVYSMTGTAGTAGDKHLGGLEFGFYNEETDKIVVFETSPLKMRPEEDAFKEGKTINLLDLSLVKISLEEVMIIAEKKRKEKYPSEIVYKNILILQNIESQVWNVTLISMAFNIINMKIDAETGELLDSSIHSIMNLGTKI